MATLTRRDGDAGADREELEPESSRGGTGQPGAVKCLPEGIEEDRREGGEEEPELVGGEAGGGGPVGEKSSCCSLMVFSMLPRAQ